MTKQSVVDFDGQARVHIGLAVKNVQESTRFYATLLGLSPSKQREGYARFEVDQPALNLSLIQHSEAKPAVLPSHFGIQVKTSASVADAMKRLAQAGIAIQTEEEKLCCHAVQDKVLAGDPDGNSWEVYVVLDDNPNEPCGANSAPAAPCCTETCCT